MQRERVEDQYPWTWEIPLAVVCAIVVLGVVVCQLGRSLANWFAGAGWRWPTPDKLVTSLPGLLAGDAAAGLSGVHHVASAAVLWGWLERRRACSRPRCSPSRACGRGVGGGRRGCAAWRRSPKPTNSSGEDRLWKVRHVVRPDLYPAGRKADR